MEFYSGDSLSGFTLTYGNASKGGGAYACTSNNCVVYSNSSDNCGFYNTLNYCCTTPR